MNSGWRHWWRGMIYAWMVALLVACGGGGGGGDTASTGGNANPTGTPQTSQARWTYLVYIAADNNLSEMASFNLEQMKAATSSADVRVVVQMDQSSTYTPGAATTSRRGLVTKGQVQWSDLGSNLDMGKRQTLADFIKWGKQTYPSDKVAVVLWSHGGGWKGDKLARGRGVAVDDTSASIMSIKDVAGALSDAGGVDLLNFDACVMAMYEVAYEMRQSAKVMVGSEENIPGKGNPYDIILNHLVATPTMSAADLGRTIANDYYAFYKAQARDSVTLSVLDLSAMANLHGAVKTLAAEMKTALATQRVTIESARAATVAYHNGNYRDLKAFASSLASRSSGSLSTAASAVVSALPAVVLSNQVFAASGSALATSSGLSIYLPTPSVVSTADLANYRSVLTSSTDSTTSWSTIVDALITGSSSGATLNQTTGGFGYYITWDNPDVDLDLYINEPQGNWAGPAFGASSPNGYSSADSFYSGSAFESYVASSVLERGGYNVIVNYFGCQPGVSTCGNTTVSVYRYDPKLGDTGYKLVATRLMKQTPAIPAFSTFANLNAALQAIATGNYGDIYMYTTVMRDESFDKPFPVVEFKRMGKALALTGK
jgi:hypothetical protein